ncbi:CsgG/HfaB family protein [Cysteiniphilum sp. QT6929]|uniref:CsgG/HfaB family protein n=1 Tax=Cysteiniphilum sp. QT6929 TaxID=2975055 RepID=UPI0024B3888C|nr:CsgG/HfaB family protein [Cysteiniphilum sp. QT6929]WHN66187.1 hypothetical protein NYP54_02875 [Cysteiniphilum sp. QT6929]
MIKKTILALSLLPAVLFAQVTEVSKNVTGVGKTYDKALKSALVQAVSQVNGVDVSSIEQSINKTFDANIDAKSSDYGDLKADVKLSKSYESSIKTATKGLINGYDVIDSKEVDGVWQLTVVVKMSEYQSIDEREKLKLYSIALTPFHFMPGSINGLIGLEQVKPMIQEALQNQFVQSRKFNVVSRSAEDFGAYKDEMAVLESGHAKPAEKARIKQLIGADFMVVGDIASFDFYQTKKEFYGEDFKTWHVGLVINYRVIETATMAIKWSDSVKVYLPSSDVAKEMNSENTAVNAIAQSLFDKAGQQIANEVIGLIYPLTILTVQGNDIYLNQGGARVQVGQKFEVRGKADTVIDPSTGEHIPIQGKKLAELEVMSVTPKYAIAKVLSGQANTVVRGLQVYPIK